MTTQEQKIVINALDAIAQNAHMLTGAFLVFIFIMFRKMSWLWYIIPAFIALIAWKEFYYDQYYEIAEVRGSNLKDFIFYQIGWMGTLILHFLSKKKNSVVV